jgi:hypothetical protein
MDATAVALGSAALAAIIAVTVPWMTFRLALGQDHERWLRDQRSELYAALLTEAYAEIQYVRHAMAPPEVRERAAEWFARTDVRQPPAERARLGARGSIFASQAVNRLFNQLQSVGSQATLIPGDEASNLRTNIQLDELWDKLQAAVRHELGADQIVLHDER